MNIRTEALAYRIYVYCHPMGWDITIADVAAAIGEPTQRVRKVCADKGWSKRMRVTARGFRPGMDRVQAGFVGEIDLPQMRGVVE